MNFRIFVKPELYEETHNWCTEEFGEERPHFRWRGIGNNELGADFYFAFEEDAVAFKLMWG